VLALCVVTQDLMGNDVAVDKWLEQVHAGSAAYVDGEAWKAPVDWPRQKPWIYSEFEAWRFASAAQQMSTAAALFDGPGSTSVPIPTKHIVNYLLALRGDRLLGVGGENAVYFILYVYHSRSIFVNLTKGGARAFWTQAGTRKRGAQFCAVFTCCPASSVSCNSTATSFDSCSRSLAR